jgi:hypothetical protein
MQDFMYKQYDDHIQSFYINALHRNKWWKCNVYLIDMYEIIYFIKKRKYSELYTCLTNMQISQNAEHIYNTMMFMINFVDIVRSKAAKVCFLYVLYLQIQKAIDNILDYEDNKAFIECIIRRSHIFMQQTENLKMLPKYLKTLICSQIRQTQQSLINKIHI